MLIQDKRNKYRKAIEAMENAFGPERDDDNYGDEEINDRTELIMMCTEIANTLFGKTEVTP